MALFIRDNKDKVYQYVPSWENKGAAGFFDLQGEFTNAADVPRDTVLDFFHASDFEEIETYLAARKLLDEILTPILDQGIITPDGSYYGFYEGVSEEDFVSALQTIKHRLPESLEKQVHAYGIGTPWLAVSMDEVKEIPSDSSKAQIKALDTIGYKDGDQVKSSGKFYNDAFPVREVRNGFQPENPAFNELIGVCVDLWDEWDNFRKANKAAYVCTSIMEMG